MQKKKNLLLFYYMKKFVASLLFLIAFNAFAQTQPDTLGNIYDDLLKPNHGTVHLKNGSVLSGPIDYRERHGEIKLTVKDRERSFNAANTVSFEFFDRTLNKKRSFASYKVSESQNAFFEIIKDYNGFTLMSANTGIQMKQKIGGPLDYFKSYGDAPTATINTTYSTIICFGQNNEVHPFIQIKTQDYDNLSGASLRKNSSKTKATFVDKDYPKILMGEKYLVVNEYSSKQKLDWKKLEDLQKILDYYKSL
jgi:hypothetical protein